MRPTTDRCTTVRISARDIDRSAENPALAALLRDGWSVITTLATVDDGSGESWVHFMLSPPKVARPPYPLWVLALMLAGAGAIAGAAAGLVVVLAG